MCLWGHGPCMLHTHPPRGCVPLQPQIMWWLWQCWEVNAVLSLGPRQECSGACRLKGALDYEAPALGWECWNASNAGAPEGQMEGASQCGLVPGSLLQHRSDRTLPRPHESRSAETPVSLSACSHCTGHWHPHSTAMHGPPGSSHWGTLPRDIPVRAAAAANSTASGSYQ